MTTCGNPQCRLAVEDGFDFCPYCGSDQRPLPQRKPVGHHDHEWFQGGYYCARCGMMDPETEARIEGQIQGKRFLAYGGIAFALAIVCLVVSNGIDSSNFNRMMAERSRLEAQGGLKSTGIDDHGPKFEASPIGTLTYVFGTIGAGLALYGISTWINNRHNQ